MKLFLEKILYLSTLSIILASCGPLNNENDAQRATNNNELRAAYGQVEGIYRGTITPLDAGADAYPVEIKVYIVDVKDGTSSDGRLQTRPELRSYYRRLDIRDDLLAYTLVTSFDKDLQEITMQSADDAFSLSGKYSAGTIKGTSRALRGEIGRIEVTRIN